MTAAIGKWPEYADQCEDKLGICEKTVLSQDQDTSIIKLKMVAPNQGIIPENYYCNFNFDLNEEYLYTVEVDRFVSHQDIYENIEFEVTGSTSGEKEKKIVVGNYDLQQTAH